MNIDKIRGCLIGGAVGDALGYQIEFARGIKDKQVSRFRDDVGIISDDTQMTLFTATALLWAQTQKLMGNENVSLRESMHSAYLDWLDTQRGTLSHKSISWIKTIPELNRLRAPGNTCLSSLSSGKIGSTVQPLNHSKGCGTIMRIAPCAMFADNPDHAGIIAVDCSVITHGHVLAWIPSYVCAHMIKSILDGNDDLYDALNRALNGLRSRASLFKENIPMFRKNSLGAFLDLIESAVDLSKKDMRDTDAIRMLGEGWTADEAFAIALYSCLKYSDNFEDAVVCAVNHDGDSDSTGAIAGNIIGTYLGFDNIQQYYVDNVELSNVILEIADDIHSLANTSPINKFVKTDSWKKKYIDCKL